MSILKVNTIQHANGTNAMTIDSSGNANLSGYVIKSNHPYFYAQSSTTQTSQVFVGNTVYSNRGGNYDSSNGRFTCPVDGIYIFSFNANGAGSGEGIGFWFLKNGTEISGSRVYDAINANSPTNETIILELQQNDYIQVYIGALGITGGDWNHFSGYLLG